MLQFLYSFERKEAGLLDAQCLERAQCFQWRVVIGHRLSSSHLSVVHGALEQRWKRLLCKPVNTKRQLEACSMRQRGAILNVAVAMNKRFVLLSPLSNTSGCGPAFLSQYLLLI